MTVPNHNYPFFWDPINWILEHLFGTHLKSGFWAGLWNQHLRLYKPEEIKTSVEIADMNIRKVESLTWWCLPFNHNLMHFAAVRLHGGELSNDMKQAINKYETGELEQPLYIRILFKIVNEIDRLNDRWSPEGAGVGVLVVSVK